MTDEGKLPAFAAAYPKNVELEALVRAFERGDYLRTREGALRLAENAPPDVRTAALDLASRTRPEPVSALFFVLAAVLLVVLFGYWVAHDGPDPSAPVPKAPSPATK